MEEGEESLLEDNRKEGELKYKSLSMVHSGTIRRAIKRKTNMDFQVCTV